MEKAMWSCSPIIPVWRHETMGSFFLVFNAMMNYDHLNAGKTAQVAPGSETSAGEDQE